VSSDDSSVSSLVDETDSEAAWRSLSESEEGIGYQSNSKARAAKRAVSVAAKRVASREQPARGSNKKAPVNRAIRSLVPMMEAITIQVEAEGAQAENETLEATVVAPSRAVVAPSREGHGRRSALASAPLQLCRPSLLLLFHHRLPKGIGSRRSRLRPARSRCSSSRVTLTVSLRNNEYSHSASEADSDQLL
jgi:hypothetical protein